MFKNVNSDIILKVMNYIQNLYNEKRHCEFNTAQFAVCTPHPSILMII